jgi:hypothetical protein
MKILKTILPLFLLIFLSGCGETEPEVDYSVPLMKRSREVRMYLRAFEEAIDKYEPLVTALELRMRQEDGSYSMVGLISTEIATVGLLTEEIETKKYGMLYIKNDLTDQDKATFDKLYAVQRARYSKLVIVAMETGAVRRNNGKLISMLPF